MEVTLPPDLSLFVDAMVAKGEYATPEDVVRASVAQMRGQDEDFELETDRIRGLIREGIDDLDNGRARKANDVFRDLYARHATRFPDDTSEAA